ncbi:MAG: MnmC family methyltransferase [Hydrococcus sp. Prado102]|jgi:tRNA U34 5-methylaminomethyl-2-thiouridine-forming methyltransferase MnmC|nr:MnmC family methyltransferase [Hydrococcus sp. Prado102]
MSSVINFPLRLTDDGSFTFFSDEFSETFHTSSGAELEAQKKFVEPCQLAEKAERPLKILDICYGLGYNSAAALKTIWAINPDCHVEIIALERDKTIPEQAIAHKLLDRWSPRIAELLQKFAQSHQIQTPRLTAQLLLGDARQTIKQVQESGFQADAIFLDPFSPPKCPQLWTVEFLSIVAQCLKRDGRLATYSCAASVRTALQLARLQVGASNSVGRRSPGTISSFSIRNLPALSQQEAEHLQTRAAIPYRDPSLQDSAELIKQRRKIEQLSSALEPTSHWKKRWSNPWV